MRLASMHHGRGTVPLTKLEVNKAKAKWLAIEKNVSFLGFMFHFNIFVSSECIFISLNHVSVQYRYVVESASDKP